MIDLITKFKAAVQVQYQNEYRKLTLADPHVGIKMLVIKSDEWAYEREFRLICPRFTDVKESPFIMDGNNLEIGPNDLTSIILGCQAGDEAAQAVKRLVTEDAPQVTVLQARRALNRYRLVVGDRL